MTEHIDPVAMSNAALRCFEQAAEHCRAMGQDKVAQAAAFKRVCDDLAADFERRAELLAAVIRDDAELANGFAQELRQLRERVAGPVAAQATGLAAVADALQDHQREGMSA